MTLRTLVIRYAVFAAIAIVFNLVTQRIVFALGHRLTDSQIPIWLSSARSDGIWFVAAMLSGTIVGLIVKYVLDKRWIFYDRQTGLKAHGAKFTLYSLMGVVTTGIFWGTESAFWLIWQTSLMREIGALIGLTAGYVMKYRLDRRFVFTSQGLEVAS